MKNILVTGGAGFIGSHLVDALVERGHRVRVLDAVVEQVHGTTGPQYLNPEAEFVQGDVCDAALVDRALDGIDVVHHEAAELGVGQSMYEIARYVRANDLGTAVLLDQVVKRRPQIEKLMVASSMSIYGEGAYACDACGPVQPKLRELSQLLDRDWELNCPRCNAKVKPMPTNEDKPLIPSSIYAISKQDQETFCLVVGRAYNIPVVALRYFNVYGPRQALSNPYTGVWIRQCLSWSIDVKIAQRDDGNVVSTADDETKLFLVLFRDRVDRRGNEWLVFIRRHRFNFVCE